MGAPVLVLVDRSRSMLLPGDGASPRDASLDAVLSNLRTAGRSARLSFRGFGDNITPDVAASVPPRANHSDLTSALREAIAQSEEAPRAIVVVSDGRLDAPSSDQAGAFSAALGARDLPIHTVAMAEREPRDASIRSVKAAGAAVAHQPMHLVVEVGCSGAMPCDGVTVEVRELLEGAAPAVLASGIAKVAQGTGTVDLAITLERAGPRLVEISIGSLSGDEVPDNDHRYLVFDVARERVRVLHVAGRPTYDVRALRTWLKSNASVDVIAFFILRSDADDVNASESELALIKFPVDELFTTELPTFDAVILQDFNAVPYRLLRYLPNLLRYVESGGGLVMVGGPDAFLGGGYAGTPLEKVLPVDLSGATTREHGEAILFDSADVVPRPTDVGRRAPMLSPLRALFGDELPSMPGSNIVGDAKQGSIVLWEHPSRKTHSSRPMPLLTLGEFGDGRSVAIALDGAHRLGFSEFAIRAAGRGHGALWDGLLGWLMRDPRFEPAQVDLPGGCIAGENASLRVTPLPGVSGSISVDVLGADDRHKSARVVVEIPPAGGPVRVPLGELGPGGYIAKVNVAGGSTTRLAFACERGGDEWADARPDIERLRAISRSTGGVAVKASDVASIKFPPATEVSAERSVSPLLPSWAWTLLAALSLGGHWMSRRRGGMA